MGRKMTKKTEAKINKLVAEHLLKVGAIDTTASEGRGHPTFRLYTKAGLMSIGLYDGWIACRFDDLERAKKLSFVDSGRLNRHSGKWNFCFPNFTAEECACIFEQELKAILKDPTESLESRAKDLLARLKDPKYAADPELYKATIENADDIKTVLDALEKLVSPAGAEEDGNDEAFIEGAKRKLISGDGEFNVDDDAVVSSSDKGAYVACWAWVSNEEAEIESDEDDEDEEDEG